MTFQATATSVALVLSRSVFMSMSHLPLLDVLRGLSRRATGAPACAYRVRAAGDNATVEWTPTGEVNAAMTPNWEAGPRGVRSHEGLSLITKCRDRRWLSTSIRRRIALVLILLSASVSAIVLA